MFLLLIQPTHFIEIGREGDYADGGTWQERGQHLVEDGPLERELHHDGRLSVPLFAFCHCVALNVILRKIFRTTIFQCAFRQVCKVATDRPLYCWEKFICYYVIYDMF